MLTANTSELIAKIAAFERDVFTKIASENRFFYGYTNAVSSSGTAGRFVDTAVAGNVERLVRVWLTDTGTVLEPVDIEDPTAELAPRYYILGTQLFEVGSDWSATTGTVNVSYGYAQAPVALDPNGSATQTITLPDRYSDLLSIRLAAYLAEKDLESRDPMELQNLQNDYGQRLSSVIDSLDQYGGVVRRRFINPANFRPTSS